MLNLNVVKKGLDSDLKTKFFFFLDSNSTQTHCENCSESLHNVPRWIEFVSAEFYPS